MKKFSLLILISVALFSCVTSIKDLKVDPTKYIGQEVLIKGTVTKLVNIPFTDYAFFEIKDKTDNILVFTLSEHKKDEIIKINCKVVGFDTTDGEKSTIELINSIEDFLIKNIKLDEEKLKKNANTIGLFLSKVLNSMNATYMLIES